MVVDTSTSYTQSCMSNAGFSQAEQIEGTLQSQPISKSEVHPQGLSQTPSGKLTKRQKQKVKQKMQQHQAMLIKANEQMIKSEATYSVGEAGSGIVGNQPMLIDQNSNMQTSKQHIQGNHPNAAKQVFNIKNVDNLHQAANEQVKGNKSCKQSESAGNSYQQKCQQFFNNDSTSNQEILQNLYYSTNFGPSGLFSSGCFRNNLTNNEVGNELQKYPNSFAQEMVKNMFEQSQINLSNMHHEILRSGTSNIINSNHMVQCSFNIQEGEQITGKTKYYRDAAKAMGQSASKSHQQKTSQTGSKQRKYSHNTADDGTESPEGVVDSESLLGANAQFDDDQKDQDNAYDYEQMSGEDDEIGENPDGSNAQPIKQKTKRRRQRRRKNKHKREKQKAIMDEMQKEDAGSQNDEASPESVQGGMPNMHHDKKPPIKDTMKPTAREIADKN